MITDASEIWLGSYIILWILVLLMAFLMAGALRQIGLLSLRFGNDPGVLITESGLDRGKLAPDFEAIDCETAEPQRFADLPERPRVVVFLSPSCVACRQLIPAVNEVAATRDGEFDFIAICHGDFESCRSFARLNRLRTRVLVDISGEITASFDVSMTPFVYLLDHKGQVLVRGVANTWSHLDSLLEQEGTIQSRQWTVSEELNS